MDKTRICKLLGIEYPVIQAPMVWITWSELAAAVSNAGGLGVMGPNAGVRTLTTDVGETGERLRREIKKVKSLTRKPFGVYLSVSARVGRAYSDQCVKVVLEEGIPAAFLVGEEPERYVRQLKDAGIKVLARGMPINVEAARRAEGAGVDAIIAVGFEGGGHVGKDCIPTFVLVPQIVDAVKVPVVAGGGIVDGRGMVAAFALGAEGVYLGTRFIATTECPAHRNFKQAIIDATDTSTVTCTGISGVLRALKSPLMERCIQLEVSGSTPEERDNCYRPGFLAGMLNGDMIGGTFPCTAAAGLIKEVKSAGEVVREIVREAAQIMAGRLRS